MNYIIDKIALLLNHSYKPWYDLYDNNLPHNLNYPNGSIYESINKSIKKYPLYKAYKYYGKTCSYLHFNLEIINCAKSLKAIGVKRKDVVTICMPNTPDAIIMFYAINLIGAISSIIDPLSSQQDIEYCIKKSNSKYLLCIDTLYKTISNITKNTNIKKVIISNISNKMSVHIKLFYNIVNKKIKIKYNDKIISWNNFEKKGLTYTGIYKEKVRKYDDAVILYNKENNNLNGIVLSNLNFNAAALQSFKAINQIKPSDILLNILPIYNSFGICSIHMALTSGMNLIQISKFNNNINNLIKRYKPNMLIVTSNILESIISNNKNNYLKYINNILCIDNTLTEKEKNNLDNYLAKHGSKACIRFGYGLTKCTFISSITPKYYYKENTIGIPLPDMIYKICEIGSNKEVKYNIEGEICIAGPTIMKRYLNNIKETKNTLKRHSNGRLYLHTGDIGYMNNEGLIFLKKK